MVARDRFGRFVAGDAPWRYGRHNLKHGHCRRDKTGRVRRSRTYNSWHSMLSNRSHPAYAFIKVCRRWQGTNGFINFLADMGTRPRGRTLDRRNPKLGYFPRNCRWATPSEQARNKRESLTVIAMRAWKSRRKNGTESTNNKARRFEDGSHLLSEVQREQEDY